MTGNGGPLKDLVSSDALSRDDLELLLESAARFAVKPLSESSFLAGESVVIYMNKASTRTRLASETAVAHLGGTPIFVRGDELQIGRGETISDTARIISAFAKAFIIRTYAQSDVTEFAKWASIPVINALTDVDHPTQLLADWVTIREIFGEKISGRKFTYLGDGNNMANAWMLMGATLGAHVTIATPPGKWAPEKTVIERAKLLAATHGGEIEITHDPESAARDASVLYTDVWMSMGDAESVRAEKLRDLAHFAVTEKIFALTSPDSVFMHCLPAHRGEEVAAEVIDGPKSVVWRQAYHRRTTIQAVLYHLINRDLQGNQVETTASQD
jgi:ornithine carbamoyltransferase